MSTAAIFQGRSISGRLSETGAKSAPPVAPGGDKQSRVKCAGLSGHLALRLRTATTCLRRRRTPTPKNNPRLAATLAACVWSRWGDERRRCGPRGCCRGRLFLTDVSCWPRRARASQAASFIIPLATCAPQQTTSD